MTHFIHEQHTGGTLKYIKKTKTLNIILCVSFFETHIKITLRKFLIHLGGLMLLSMNEDFSMSKHDITYQPCTAMLEVFLLKVFFNSYSFISIEDVKFANFWWLKILKLS